MATAAVTNTFIANTPAEAAEVNTNFSDLVDFLNNQVIHKDGSKAMTGALDMGSQKVTSLAVPTAAADAARFGDAAKSNYKVNSAGTTITTSGSTVCTFTVYADAAGMAMIMLYGGITASGVSGLGGGGGEAGVTTTVSVTGATELGSWGSFSNVATNSSSTSAAWGPFLVSLAGGTNTIVVKLTRVNASGVSGGTITLKTDFRAMIVGA